MNADRSKPTGAGTDRPLAGWQAISAELIAAVAKDEHVSPEQVRLGLQAGSIVVMGSPGGPVRPLGIGLGLRTKVNANLGTSEDFPDLDDELRKLEVAVGTGADTVMDLSTGGDLDRIRRAIRRECPVALGTVPVYQAAIEAVERFGSVEAMTPELLFDVIERHAADGVDFQTLHCGVTRATVAALETGSRVCGIVSRGGSMLARWMKATGAENPLYERYDDLLAILKRYGVLISLGDGLRPGALADASDRGQTAETVVLGELVARAREAGVQSFVEGPGHMPMDQIAATVTMQKCLCHGAPFYVLGPLVTDVAPGYDHITGAIGGAICAAAGADFLCYVTPAEHLGLPRPQDVLEGVMASRIAAHAADIVKGVAGARDWDDRLSAARHSFDWASVTRLALDPGRVKSVRAQRASADDEACSMCGRFCSMKVRSALTDK